MTISELYKKYEAYDPLAVAQESFDQTAEMYAQLNAEQMYDGLDSQDQLIKLDGKGYAASTIKIKQRKGQPTDRVTLKDSGKFYQGLYATMEGRYIKSGSTDFKADWLQNRSGKNIFGLGPDNKKAFATGVFLEVMLTKSKEILK